MLTKNQTKILDALITMDKGNRPYDVVELHIRTRIYDHNELLRAGRSLREQGYLEDYAVDMTGEPYVMRLSNSGTHYKELQRSAGWEKWKERIIGFCFAILLWLLQQFVIPLILK